MFKRILPFFIVAGLVTGSLLIVFYFNAPVSGLDGVAQVGRGSLDDSFFIREINIKEDGKFIIHGQLVVGREVTFEAKVTGGQPSIIYGWEFKNKDSGNSASSALGERVFKTFSEAGFYEVKLTLVDSAGKKTEKVNNFRVVEPEFPMGNVSLKDGSKNIDPDEVPVNKPISFSATTRGGFAPVVYTWEFSDGVKLTGKTVTKSFDNANAFDVTVTITDSRNRTASQKVAGKVVNNYVAHHSQVTPAQVTSNQQPANHSQVTNNPNPPLISSFRMFPAEIDYNHMSFALWTTRNTVSCQMSNNLFPGLGRPKSLPSSSAIQYPEPPYTVGRFPNAPTADIDVELTLTCFGEGGQSDTKTANVLIRGVEYEETEQPYSLRILRDGARDTSSVGISQSNSHTFYRDRTETPLINMEYVISPMMNNARAEEMIIDTSGNIVLQREVSLRADGKSNLRWTPPDAPFYDARVYSVRICPLVENRSLKTNCTLRVYQIEDLSIDFE